MTGKRRWRIAASLVGLFVVLAAGVALLGLVSEALPTWAFVCVVCVVAVVVTAAIAVRRQGKN